VCNTMNTETSLSSRYKQRIVIEFLTAENCAPKVIHSRLKNVYGDETIDISNVRRWVRNTKVVEKGQIKNDQDAIKLQLQK